MRGEFFLGQRTFELRNMEIPELGSGEVLVRVGACGICGTDVHIYEGGKGSAEVHPPVVLGHEIAGVVERIGADVTTVSVGDHVALDPNMYCNTCRACRMGKKQACSHLEAIGVTQNGGFADYCVVPQAQCYTVDKAIPLEHAALAEPIACCLHGIDRANIQPGSVVCVIGGGAIGLIMVQLAKLAGAATVVLSEPNAMRREIGLKVGADLTVDPINEDLAKRLQDVTQSDGADVVIECVGNLIATQQAFAAAGSCATILLFSVPKPDSEAKLPLDDVFKKEWTIVGSLINPDTHKRAVELLNHGRLQLSPLITHAYPLGKLEEAIHMQMKDESIKVIMKPDLSEPLVF